MKKIIQYFVVGLLILITACDEANYDYSADQSDVTGTGGSMARFAISDNFLYTVESSSLKIFSLANEKIPEYTSETSILAEVQTLFIKGDLMFIGSFDGVYIYDISTPESPQFLSVYSHVRSCDPVVVKGNYAYSTLNSTGPCSQGINQLDIIDISNPHYPQQVNTLAMENPQGLGILGSLLFVCDEGLKVFDITNPTDPVFQHKIQIDAFDVIPIDTLLLVATEQGLSEYFVDNSNQIHFVSSLFSK